MIAFEQPLHTGKRARLTNTSSTSVPCPRQRRPSAGERLRRAFGSAGTAAAMVAASVVVGGATPAMAAQHGPATGVRPDRYVVSDEPGVLPEGIGLGRGRQFYVTSSATGAVYQGDLRSPRMRPFLPAGADGRTSALGVHTDQDGRVFIAGAAALDVYSPAGQLLAHRPAPAGPVGPPSLNDLVITDDAVYVTDFANPVVLRADLKYGHVGPLRPWLDTRSVAPQLPARFWFLNGVVAAPGGRILLVASQGLATVLRVDIERTAATTIDLGTAPFAADGMQLRGHRLYAVLNVDPPQGQGVYIADLDPTFSAGTVSAVFTGRPGQLDSPTTLALDADRILVVNSQLDHPPGTPPYTVAVLAGGASVTAGEPS